MRIWGQRGKSSACLRLEVEDSEILEHLVPLLYHIDEQAVLGAAVSALFLLDGLTRAGSRAAVRGQVGEDVSDLRVERGAHRLPLQQRRHAARVFVAESAVKSRTCFVVSILISY